MDARTDRSLVVIGSGPGIGRHVASSFAIKRFNKVALVARTASSLAADQAAVEAAAAGKVTVKTYQVDITEGEQFAKALNKIGQELGTPECVLFNAATIVPTKLLGIEEDQMLYDFKTTCTALHIAAKWAIPKLLDVAETDPVARSSFLVTSSLLPQDPIPDLFLLSMVKAAQKNMVQSMAKLFAPRGVHVGLITVGGPVDPSSETLNPANIASRTWELFEQPKGQQTLEIEVL